ncbi:MAG TPA: hypothetical protein VFB46_13935 [Gemmatimonadaceae bacterium]|nr:hypothetical protein [Gemmatimonadaceae bacterium]
MGGSKPSQFWQKEPAATDRKWRAEDEGVLEREKHELTGSDAQEREMIPGQQRKPQNRAGSVSKGKKKRAGKRGKSGR